MDANDLHPWLYPVTINGEAITPGVGSGQSPQRLIRRADYHRKFLVGAMLGRYDFTGKGVLDVGSNCGYWSLEYARMGSFYTHLIEGREKAIQQGKLLWKDAGFESCWFHYEDVMKVDYSLFNVDFTICAGILYHVKEWELLLERINTCTREGILIETAVAEQDRTTQERPGCFNAIDARLTKRIPTAERLLEVVEPCGAVEVLSEATLKVFNKKRMVVWVKKGDKWT